MTKAKTPRENLTTALTNARASINSMPLSAKVRERLTARLDRIELDVEKETYMLNAPEKVMILDRLSGEMTTVEGYKAALATWYSKDKEGYTTFADEFIKFLSQYKDDSLFVRMFGRKGERVLPQKEIGIDAI